MHINKKRGSISIGISMNEKRFSKFFKAFGDPSRLRILMLLSGQEMTVNDIVKAVELSQPTVSRHLAILREAEVVADRREGQKVYYSLNKKIVGGCCVGFCDCLAIPVRVSRRPKK
jgi:DNA-binding transcriptional ArsR family regulator